MYSFTLTEFTVAFEPYAEISVTLITFLTFQQWLKESSTAKIYLKILMLQGFELYSSYVVFIF